MQFKKTILRHFRNVLVYLKKPKNICIIGDYYFLNNIKFNIDDSSDLKIYISEGVKLSNTTFYIRGKGHEIYLGKNVRIKEGIFWMEDILGKIKLGNMTSVESAEFACTEPNSIINIGIDCMLSKGIEIRTGDSHSILDAESCKRINCAENIEIGDKVWLGAHVIVLKGAIIESNVIVGTGSIVTKKVVLEKDSIYTGNPIRKIKTGIYWDRKRLYN